MEGAFDWMAIWWHERSDWIVLALVAVLMLAASLRGPAGVRTSLRLISGAVAFAATAVAVGSMAWGWALASLPALIITQHAVYLVLIKPRFIDRDPKKLKEHV